MTWCEVTWQQVWTSHCRPAVVAAFWACCACWAFCACAPISVEAFEELAPAVCPSGSLEPEPGVCGCDVLDADFDADGAPDCIDECPDNAGQSTPSGPC